MTFSTRIRAGDRILAGTFLNLGSTVTAELMALSGLDWVAIDLEHGAGDELEMGRQLQSIARTGVGGLVRLESSDRSRIAHALDAGADGVIVPQIRSSAEAAHVVSWCRYGQTRGVARYNRAWQWGVRPGSLADADEGVVCCIQVERRDALEDVERIASVEGVDVLFVGPADLSHALGIDGPADHPALLTAAQTVVQAARGHGKVAGVLAGTVDQLRSYRELGFTMLGCSSDSGLLMKRAQEIAKEIHELEV